MREIQISPPEIEKKLNKMNSVHSVRSFVDVKITKDKINLEKKNSTIKFEENNRSTNYSTRTGLPFDNFFFIYLKIIKN